MSLPRSSSFSRRKRQQPASRRCSVGVTDCLAPFFLGICTHGSIYCTPTLSNPIPTQPLYRCTVDWQPPERLQQSRSTYSLSLFYFSPLSFLDRQTAYAILPPVPPYVGAPIAYKALHWLKVSHGGDVTRKLIFSSIQLFMNVYNVSRLIHWRK